MFKKFLKSKKAKPKLTKDIKEKAAEKIAKPLKADVSLDEVQITTSKKLTAEGWLRKQKNI
ncbi:MAG: hypothetical protein WCT85_07280 [Parachlamydiales bacterium]|jgi:hypothetical protein